MDLSTGTCFFIGTNIFKLMLTKLNLGCYSLENFTGEYLICFYNLSNPKDRFTCKPKIAEELINHGESFVLSFKKEDILYIHRYDDEIRSHEMAKYFHLLMGKQKNTGANHNSGIQF